MPKYIDQHEAYNKLKEKAEMYMLYFTSDAFEKAASIIAMMPAIEAEPVRHGRWIPTEYDGYADGYPVYELWKCSECRNEHEGDADTLTAYCPHCGSKMDGGENNG